MSDMKTVQRRIRPITVRCGTPGCTTKPADAVLEEHEAGSSPEVIAPKGWTFPATIAVTGGVVVGACPVHAKK